MGITQKELQLLNQFLDVPLLSPVGGLGISHLLLFLNPFLLSSHLHLPWNPKTTLPTVDMGRCKAFAFALMPPEKSVRYGSLR